MTQISDAIAARVRGLMAKTIENGATEAEAMAAAAKARELMDRYRVTMTDIEIKAEPIVSETVDRQNELKLSPADYCLHGIDAYCGIKSWFRKSGGVRRLQLFGMKPDVEMARYLYEMIGSAINVECERWKRSAAYQDSYDRRSASTSFKIGMASRVSTRLKEMARALEPVAKSASGTALVVVKGAAVQEAYAALGLKMGRGARGASVRSSAGYGAGGAAGDRVNLSRPVAGYGQRYVTD